MNQSVTSFSNQHSRNNTLKVARMLKETSPCDRVRLRKLYNKHFLGREETWSECTEPINDCE